MQLLAMCRFQPAIRDVVTKFAPYAVALLLVLTSFAPVVLFAQEVTETRKVVPVGVDANDNFGFSVAVSGSTVLAGSPFDEDLAPAAGSVYQFDANSGTLVRKILAVDPSTNQVLGDAEDFLGESVALEGDIAVIGARRDGTEGRFAGAAYIFNTATGNLITRLLPFSPIINDPTAQFFGFSTAVSDDFIVVGAPGDVEQDSGAGSAYIYSGVNNPQVVAKIFASDPGFADNFGRRVAVSNTTAAVAAPFDNDNGDDSGSIYLFDATTGQQQVKITPDDGAAGDLFGLGLAISDSVVAVGAPFADANGADSGAVYLFDVATGQQIAKLTPDDGEAGDRFGQSVDIDGSTLIVGATLDDDVRDADVGSAYLFDIETGAQQAKLLASDGQEGDGFGFSVSISGSNVVVGAIGDDDRGSLSGSIYVFELDGTPVTPTPPTTTPVPPTPAPSPTPTPPSGSGPDTLYASLLRNGSGFRDEDILTYDISTDQLSVFFDGSDVGLGRADVDAFALLGDGSLLLSFNNPFSVGGINADDSDVLRFVPTSLGSSTTGSFSLYIDGSDIGLTTNGEDIDGLEVLAEDGNGVTLLVSTAGNFNVPGATGRDEDLVQLTVSQTGNTTNGTWSPFFDGSDIGLANSGSEDVWGASLVDGDLYLTTRGAFSVNGASGDGADVLQCSSFLAGATTSCAFDPFLDGVTIGIDGNSLDSILLRSGSGSANAAARLQAQPDVLGSTDTTDETTTDDVEVQDPDQVGVFLPLVIGK